MRLVSAFWGYVIFWIFLTLIILIGILISARRITQIYADRVVCAIKLESLSVAVKVYADTSEGQYPTPEKWCDLIMQNPGELIEDAFCCPVDPKGSFSYAINENLYNIELEKNIGQWPIVVIFEANLGRNGVGGPEDLIMRHDQDGRLGCNIAYTDGHVEFVTEDRIADLKWTVEQSEK